MTASVWGDAAAERVARTRQALDWLVERFAEELTEMVEPVALRRWEAGRCAPPGDVVMAAEALRTRGIRGIRGIRGRHLQLVGVQS
jgi:hypothetical protein